MSLPFGRWMISPATFFVALQSARTRTAALARHWVWLSAAAICLLVSTYWLVLASDRFVSEAHVIVQRTDMPGGQSLDMLGLLGNGAAGRADQLLLREHLLSIDMLRRLDAALDLRAHYSQSGVDFLSRMWSKDAPLERFHGYYRSRISVEFDEYTGVLTIGVQAYDRNTAYAIARLLLAEGERFMNGMAHDLAQAQVSFLEGQVNAIHDRAVQARQDLLAYQNQRGLISPIATAEGLAAVVARLEAQRSDLQIQRSALKAYLVADHPNVVMVDQQLAAVERQIAQEKSKLAAPSGRTLNRTVEEYQRLEAEATFTQDMYKAALSALEKGRIEAQRTVKKVSVLQAPTLPEYAIAPRRLYNAFAWCAVVLLLAGIASLLVAIVRDHLD